MSSPLLAPQEDQDYQDADEHNANAGDTVRSTAAACQKDDEQPAPLLLLLGDPAEDPKWLSPPLCLVRSQIEVFAATPADVADRTRHPPTVGQVGLRCVHCRPPLHRTNATCARGAVSFPKKINLIHQTIRNFQRYHVLDCPDMPADVKEQLEAYADQKKQHQSRRDGAAAYWVDSFRSLGVRDVVNVAAAGFGEGGGGAAMMKEEIRFVDGKDGARQRVAFDNDGATSNSAGETGEVDMEAIKARRVYVPAPRCHNQVTPPTLQETAPVHTTPPVEGPPISHPNAVPQIDSDRDIIINDDDDDDADFLADIGDGLISSELSTLRTALGLDEMHPSPVRTDGSAVTHALETTPVHAEGMGEASSPQINADIDDADFLADLDDELDNCKLSNLNTALGLDKEDKEDMICQQQPKTVTNNEAAASSNVSGTPLQEQPDSKDDHQKKKHGILAVPRKATASPKQLMSHRPPPSDQTEGTANCSKGSNKKRQRRRISDKEMAPFDDEDAPAGYTAQDELREMSSLSISEVIARESDLRGIMRPGNQKLLSALQEADLLEMLDDELAGLRDADTTAYREALIRCPDQVSDERRMRFIYVAFGELRAGELNTMLHFLDNPNRAFNTQIQRNQAARIEMQIQKLIKECAEALARHWQLRYDLFGPDRCYLPMTLDGAMQDEVDNLVNRGVVQLLPVPDKSGRAIVYSDLTRRDLSKYSSKQECMAFFYFQEVIAEDLDSLRAGFISLHNSFGIGKSAFNKPQRELAARSDDFSSLICRALHVVNPSPIVHHFILPIVKNLFGKSLRLRVATHIGPPDKILRQLEQYRLPQECIPVELGGSLQYDMEEWVTKRREIETERSKKLNAIERKLSEPMRTNLSPAIEAIRLNEMSKKPELESTTKRARTVNPED